MLSDSESDGDNNSEHQLTINEHYAKAFQYRKEREELTRLKEKYGSDYGEDDEDSVSDSESDESEDEDGEELTPVVDAAILRTLARIRKKDPEIYQSGKDIFTEEQARITDAKPRIKSKKDKSKPITVRQVALEAALNPSSRSPSPEPATFIDEQRVLREETIAAFHGSELDDDDDDDELLVPREKTKDELEHEEEEYKEFLQRQVGSDLKQLVIIDPDNIRLDIEDEDILLVGSDRQKKANGKGKKRTKVDREAEDQEFLMNYILNRGWLDRSSKRLPTYEEITGSGDKKEPEDTPENGDAVDEDEEFEDVVDQFESSYNFRFEEPDADVIKTFPRNLTTTVRREENPRKAARERKKQRKEEKLLQKKEEINRLKALKLKDIRTKLDQIGQEGGKDFDDTVLRELDLEGEWDPEKHDAQMAGLYESDGVEADDEKPTWADEIDVDDIDELPPGESSSSNKKKKKKKKVDAVDMDDGVDIDAMDADIPIQDEDDEEWDGTEEMRKRKVAKYMEELYSLDFNDMVGDMPTRFKYATVQPQAYALTPAEILMATDAELNEYMGVKRFAPYRKDTKWDPKRTEKLKDLKRKLTERGAVAESSKEEKPTKRKGKKERMKLKEATVGNAAASDNVAGVTITGDEEMPPTKKRRRHKKKDA